MCKILVLYGGIGDTIMAIEAIKVNPPDLIFANKLAYEVLRVLDIRIQIKYFELEICDSILGRLKYPLNILLLWVRLMRESPTKTIFLSFNSLWMFLPFIHGCGFKANDLNKPRIEAIKRLLAL